MKYPLRVVKLRSDYVISDAAGKYVAHITDDEWGHQFAAAIVKWANRWGGARRWFRKYNRNDWLEGKNTVPRGPIKVTEIRKRAS